MCDKHLLSERTKRPAKQADTQVFAAELNPVIIFGRLCPTGSVQVLGAQLNHHIHFISSFFFFHFGLWIMTLFSLCVGVCCFQALMEISSI